MVETVLVIGATGQVGWQIVRELDANSGDLAVRLATRRPEVAEQWRAEGRDAVVLDLDNPAHYARALEGVSRVFLLTGYSADMLHQSKRLVDAATTAGVSHLVHLGVFNSGDDDIPHFSWHQLIETYIKASGIAWTHLHPNVIYSDAWAAPIRETGTLTGWWQEAPQGYVHTADIAAVAAEVLREGPSQHGGADYWLSTEVLTGPQIADILTDVLGRKITYTSMGPDDLADGVAKIPSAAKRLYMQSAVQTMRQAVLGNMRFQNVVRDDVQTVLGRPGVTVREWARRTFADAT
ncbi:NmrA family NAD(P)-binding protein [Streptomyces sp. NPDC005549]|uniref:NmrA family NAD(P)-binding protein n=1 Tax=Streptomyces sp. NPDC005549 TaxID=3154888 RepID=UPI0033B5DB62